MTKERGNGEHLGVADSITPHLSPTARSTLSNSWEMVVVRGREGMLAILDTALLALNGLCLLPPMIFLKPMLNRLGLFAHYHLYPACKETPVPTTPQTYTSFYSPGLSPIRSTLTASASAGRTCIYSTIQFVLHGLHGCCPSPNTSFSIDNSRPSTGDSHVTLPSLIFLESGFITPSVANKRYPARIALP
jgi:hypothetical protein